MQEPKGASLEDALPSSHWETGVGKNVLHNSNQEKKHIGVLTRLPFSPKPLEMRLRTLAFSSHPSFDLL
jgi:hypothetical protein